MRRSTVRFRPAAPKNDKRGQQSLALSHRGSPGAQQPARLEDPRMKRSPRAVEPAAFRDQESLLFHKIEERWQAYCKLAPFSGNNPPFRTENAVEVASLSGPADLPHADHSMNQIGQDGRRGRC